LKKYFKKVSKETLLILLSKIKYDNLIDFIKKCVMYDKKCHPSISFLLKHQFISGHISRKISLNNLISDDSFSNCFEKYKSSEKYELNYTKELIPKFENYKTKKQKFNNLKKANSFSIKDSSLRFVVKIKNFDKNYNIHFSYNPKIDTLDKIGEEMRNDLKIIPELNVKAIISKMALLCILTK